MFREMRRFRQQLGEEDTRAVLSKGSSGVLALAGDEGYPYAVPQSYVIDGDILYFQTATEGHKVDAVKREPKASFCVIDMDCILPDRLTTCYRSAIAFGKMSIVEDPKEKRYAIEMLVDKYSDKTPEENAASIDKMWSLLCVLRMDIEHLTGKQAKELMK
ncbi:MAG: pyridoxamine 5'-phosphate oxidase family protein [Clostridia bacterium]|nr:pyridoxamine 5'-phosphate oxidase family protein [Clostridia bacterium]